ncbi:hypothetical protein ACQI4L_16260 [Mycolicibacterium litorale]|uniref:hypothetical protein n=1 Tax=Mycolicibacterium litorale TaxID=758802 RepID=UPI003CE6B8E2
MRSRLSTWDVHATKGTVVVTEAIGSDSAGCRRGTDLRSTYLAAGHDPKIRTALRGFGLRLLFRHSDTELSAYLTPDGVELDPAVADPVLTVDAESRSMAELFDGTATFAGALHRRRLVIRGPVKHALNLVSVLPGIAGHHQPSSAVHVNG